MTLAIFSIVLFIQLGVSFYVSFQMAGFLICIFMLKHQAFSEDSNYTYIVLFTLALSCIIFSHSTYGMQEFLRLTREFICIIVFIWGLFAVSDSNKLKSMNSNFRPLSAVGKLLFLLFIFIFIQFVFSKIGFFITLPTDMYVINAPRFDFEDLYNNFDMTSRVSLTYGEPSYLGLIVLGFTCWALVSEKYKYLYLLGFIAFFSGSSFAFLSMFTVITFYFLERKRGKIVAYLGLGLASVFYIAGVISFEEQLMLYKGESAFIRLYAPWLILEDILLNEPFGVPFSQIQDYIDSSLYAYLLLMDGPSIQYIGFDNALINLVYSYGYVGIVLIVLIFTLFIYKRISILYFLIWFLFALQNGSIFTFDKVFLILFFYYLIYNELKAKGRCCELG